MKNSVPAGHSFNVVPIQFNFADSDLMMNDILTNRVIEEMVTLSGKVRHALRTKIFVYPENVVVVWLVIAVYYRK